MKIRLIRFLRTPPYNELFSGDPFWATIALTGMKENGEHLVTKTSYRILQTLYNLGPSPEPNLTVLWAKDLPQNWKKFCVKTSIDTSCLQYENDDIIRPLYGSNYGIACCVSSMKQGEQMQYFGARINAPKLFLYALNNGVDELTGQQVAPTNLFNFPKTDKLDYDIVLKAFKLYLEWGLRLYVDTMNCIHYSHDKYYYERLQMALHNTHLERLMAFGTCGIGVITDALSAIKYAKVTVKRDSKGITNSFDVDGDFPRYGNDDKRVDTIAVEVVKMIHDELNKHKLYRDAKPTLSLLTITSNVVYAKSTGSLPGSHTYKSGIAFPAGASPCYGAETNGAIAALNSVASIPFDYCKDGISNTFCISPQTLGKDTKSQLENGVSLLDGYFAHGAQHLNFNVLNKETLIDAMKNPDKYPSLCIRVSGYAVLFNSLTEEQKQDVINRTVFTKF
jgi:formate C-acetyltransferase